MNNSINYVWMNEDGKWLRFNWVEKSGRIADMHHTYEWVSNIHDATVASYLPSATTWSKEGEPTVVAKIPATLTTTRVVTLHRIID